MPFPLPKPAVLPTEGWQYGYIMASPFIDDVTFNKGKPNQQDVQVIRLKCITAVPDENGNVETKAEGDIFLYNALDEGGSNWAYQAFLEALNIENIMVDVGDGKTEEMLPDPNCASYVGKPVKFMVFHKVWESNNGPVNQAKIKKYDSWDGKDPESGEEAKAPAILINVPDDEKPLPF